MPTILRGVSLFAVILSAASAQMLPDSQALIMNELEHLYFDYNGPAGFKASIVPCTQYLDLSTGLPNHTKGQETAAEWIRTAFHDFVTADVATGTGGLDASINFETSRPENVGVAFNDTLIFLSFFLNAKLSMADLIALSVATAVGGCGGPQIPLRGGRVDATGPGPYGVPEPQTDLKTTLAEFFSAGFNQEDSIGLTACGHTMGGVHYSTFPQIVPESSIGVKNSDGRVAFDDTVALFDVNVVQQYIYDNGSRGGPLVTTSNKACQANLRLYNSDGNATMHKLGQSTDQFQKTCSTLMTRMIDTVPKGVTLTPLIDPCNLQHSNLTLSVDWSGQLTLSGFLRYIESTESARAPTSFKVTVIDRKGHLTKNSVIANTDTINYSNGIYGPTYHYPFTISITGSSGLSGIVANHQRFQLQDSLFVVPTLSSINPGVAAFNLFDPEHEFTINITAALRSPNSPRTLKGTLAIPVPQGGTISPRIDSSTTVQLSLIGTAGPFAMYSVVHQQNLTSKQFFQSSIDIVDERGDAEAMFFKLYSLLAYF